MVTMSLQTLQRFIICKLFMPQMSKQWYSILKICPIRKPLIVSSSAREGLLLIAMASLSAQETKEMAWESWNFLEIWNQVTTFLEFFQVLFSLYSPPNLVFLVCTCPLYTTDWIRVTIMLSIFVNYDLWSWFDFHENLSKISQNQSFYAQSCLTRFDPLASCIRYLKYAQNLKVWMIWIFSWFILI